MVSRGVFFDLYGTLLIYGDMERVFVALELAILGGRNDGVKRQIADSLFAVLCATFPRTLEVDRSSLTVRVTDIHRASYCRAMGERTE